MDSLASRMRITLGATKERIFSLRKRQPKIGVKRKYPVAINKHLGSLGVECWAHKQWVVRRGGRPPRGLTCSK